MKRPARSDVFAAVQSVRLLQETIPCPRPARNLGVAASNGDLLALLHADCIACKGLTGPGNPVMRRSALHEAGPPYRPIGGQRATAHGYRPKD